MVIRVPKLEADVGMEVYASGGRGIDGRIRSFPEDFIVEEILIDGSKASVQLKEEITPPSGHGRYLICLLVKKRWDTLLAVREIANSIGMDSERIGVAGIKDTEALTAQHISIGGVSPERVLKVNLKDLIIKPLGFSDEKISSSLLFGNHFTIMVRSIKYGSSTVQRRIEKIKSELTDLGGIPNFFGPQRFGTIRPITHHIGRYIVKGNFENAALVFLSQPSPYEHPEARMARKHLMETRDFKMALKLFPRKLMYERLMLIHLSKYPRDFLGAFHRLPPNLCKLLVQAYQSFLFNRFLSERIKRGLPLAEAQTGDYTMNIDKNEPLTESFNKKISKGKTILAIPLIGFKQPSSGGVQGEIEREILEKEGMKPEDFRIQRIPEASAPGGLRTALAQVLDLEIEKKEETSPNGLSVKFSFRLHKGSYATVLLREFMKPKNLIKAGF